MSSGMIRFVGGPWHNRIVSCGQHGDYWRQIVSIPVYRPRLVSFAKLEREVMPDAIEVADYRLEAVCVNLTARGPIRFWEYHCCDLSNGQAVASGGDGVVTNMRI